VTLDAVFSLLHTTIDPSHVSIGDVEVFQSNFASEKQADDFYRLMNEKMQVSRSIFDVGHIHEFANRCTSVASGAYVLFECLWLGRTGQAQ
jgi:hypothetical protein